MKNLRSRFLFSICLICLIFSGCTITNQYARAYNSAIDNRTSTVIFQQGDFQDIKAKVEEHLTALGYRRVLYQVPKQGFVVMAKDVSIVKSLLIGEAYPSRIIMKYTKEKPGTTRIDFVNGTNNIFDKKTVDKDIQELKRLLAAQ